MKTHTEIMGIINTASRWECIPIRGHYTVWCDGDDTTITMEELATVDTRLPLVMEDMLHRRRHSLESLPGYWARYTLAFWNGELLTIASWCGDVHAIHEPKYLYLPEIHNGDVVKWGGYMSGTAAVGFDKKTSPPPILYIEYACENELPVLSTKMDEHYPGWRERLVALEAVGATDAEIIKHVLVNEPKVEQVVVPDDMFATL